LVISNHAQNMTMIGRSFSDPWTDRRTDRQTDRRSYHNNPFPYQKKGKGMPYRLRSVGGVLNAYLPSLGREPVGGYTTEVCDA